jgi:hypothetical protein
VAGAADRVAFLVQKQGQRKATKEKLQHATFIYSSSLPIFSCPPMWTAVPCERFAASAEAPPCKENLLRFCNTDLASVAYNWPRFVSEERAFSKMESHGIGLNDGLLAQLLKASGWKVGLALSGRVWQERRLFALSDCSPSQCSCGLHLLPCNPVKRRLLPVPPRRFTE